MVFTEILLAPCPFLIYRFIMGLFQIISLEVVRIPAPDKNNYLKSIALIQQLAKKDDIAAFVYEPLVQGAAAMKMHSAVALDEILKTVKALNIISIADEVMTGFGKTGKNFASEFMQTLPDIICLSKSLTGGLVPMAITSCSNAIYDAFLSSKMEHGFFHGHTYSANPTSCTAALASLELLQSASIRRNIKMVQKSHEHFNDKIKNHPKVKSTRQQGIIYAFRLQR